MRTTNDELNNGGDALADELIEHLEENNTKCGHKMEISPIEVQLRRGARIDRLHAQLDGLYAEVGRLKMENAKLRATS
jgi:hypothetical protein